MEPQETAKRPQEEVDGTGSETANGSNGEPAAKKLKIDEPAPVLVDVVDAPQEAPKPRPKGVAPIKQE